MKRLWINYALVLLLLAICSTATGQLTAFSPVPTTPQAKSEDELDAYGRVFDSANPEEVIAQAQLFLSRYPKSEFCLYVLLQEMHAYESLNDHREVLATGRAALRLSPRNIDALTTLSYAIADHLPPDGAVRQVRLAEAEDHLTKASKQLANLVRPFSIPRREFGRYKQETQSRIASTFGLIALDRKNAPMAITEYKIAIGSIPHPRGADYYRLGGAYLLNGQYQKAIGSLQRAAALGPPLITALAQQQMLRIRKTEGSPSTKQSPARTHSDVQANKTR